MLKKTITATLLAILFNFTFSPFLFAQSKPDQNAAKYKMRVAKRGIGGKPIVIKLKDKSKFTGVINDIKDDFFVLKEKKTGVLTNIYYNQIEDIDRAFSKFENTLAIIAVGAMAIIIVACVAGKCQN